tara:strand:+ start:708 stop:944 length:237 start_codon:yes stop_codon:yes gene_type:complete
MEEQVTLTVGSLLITIILTVLGTLTAGIISIFLYIKYRGTEAFSDNFAKAMNRIGQYIEHVTNKAIQVENNENNKQNT